MRVLVRRFLRGSAGPCAAAVLVATGAGALADPDQSARLQEGLAMSGYTISDSKAIDSKPCRVDLNMDQHKFLENAPELAKSEIFASDVTERTIRTKPTMFTVAFASQAMPIIVKTIYEDHAGVDRCHFTQYLTQLDDYGNDTKKVLATFDFTRAIFAKINWDKFQTSSFMKIAPNFHLSPEVMRAVVGEQ